MSRPPTALIAEDEPLLAAALRSDLARAWPGLHILPSAGDGATAVAMALEHQPDVLFLDIRMPALSGLEAAAELADAWPATAQHHKPFPALVFVTAYDQYAVQAFEAQAMDYLLKPVQFSRLQKTVSKVQLALSTHTHEATNSIAISDPNGLALEATLAQLRHLLTATSAALPAANGSVGTASPAPLKHIQASVGSALHMVPVAEVVYFEAADKYVRVLTCEREYLIRTPLKDLLPQLGASFWQIHRGAVVNADCIDLITRDESGKLHVSLRGRPEKLPVSRLYAYLFKAM